MTAPPLCRRIPTINDVAVRAGVSAATVSKVMNSRRGVAASTAERVQRAIDGLGYEPSLAAQHLRGATDCVIGVLYPQLGPWEGEVLKGVSSAAAGSGHGLLAFSAAEGSASRGWEGRALSRLGGSLIDGAIVIAPSIDAVAGSLPTIAVLAHGPGPRLPVVRPDEIAAGELATRHLIELGHRRIGYLGRRAAPHPRAHEAGYRRALLRAGIDVDPAMVRYDTTAEQAARSVIALLGLTDQPTAVVASDDALALVAREMSEGSARGQLSVVGSGNTARSAQAAVALTTISHRPMELGRAAFFALMTAMGSGSWAQQEVVVLAELIVRASTGPPRAAA